MKHGLFELASFPCACFKGKSKGTHRAELTKGTFLFAFFGVKKGNARAA